MSKRKGGPTKAKKPDTETKKRPKVPTIKPFKRVFISGDQFRYDWKEETVRSFIRDYIEARTDGVDSLDIIEGLSGKYRRRAEEVAILIMDLGLRGYIGPRGKGNNPRLFKIDDCNAQDQMRGVMS